MHARHRTCIELRSNTVAPTPASNPATTLETVAGRTAASSDSRTAITSSVARPRTRARSGAAASHADAATILWSAEGHWREHTHNHSRTWYDMWIIACLQRNIVCLQVFHIWNGPCFWLQGNNTRQWQVCAAVYRHSQAALARSASQAWLPRREVCRRHVGGVAHCCTALTPTASTTASASKRSTAPSRVQTSTLQHAHSQLVYILLRSNAMASLTALNITVTTAFVAAPSTIPALPPSTTPQQCHLLIQQAQHLAPRPAWLGSTCIARRPPSSRAPPASSRARHGRNIWSATLPRHQRTSNASCASMCQIVCMKRETERLLLTTDI